MIVEATGTNTWNKGAELMLVAIKQHFDALQDVHLAVDQHFGSYFERARYGLLQKVAVHGVGRSRLALALLPPSFRRTFGLVTDSEVDALIDASGFAFGDQHPPERCRAFAGKVEQARKAGKKVILLPQALGPFERPTLREDFRRVLDSVDLVFARDEVSLQHVMKVGGDPEKVRIAPDFTNLIQPVLRVESRDSDRVCIVPNQRMVEKAETKADADAYVPFLAECVAAVGRIGLRAVMLLHGTHDAALVEAVQRKVGHTVETHVEGDPVAIKQYLGESHVVIASRFHALVSALSQGIPAIGTSWSHKYEMLFRDYGCERLLLHATNDSGAIGDALSYCTGSGRDALIRTLKDNGRVQRDAANRMWAEVDAVLGLGGRGQRPPSDVIRDASLPAEHATNVR